MSSRMSWEGKKFVWSRYARGESVQNTIKYLESLTEDEYPDGLFHRDTINEVREELMTIELSMMRQLVTELPEIQGFVERIRPDCKGKLITNEAIEEHFRHIKKIANELALLQEDNLDKSQLSGKLKWMVDVVCEHYGEPDFSFFLEHFHAVCPEVQSRDDYLAMAESNPEGLLEKLKIIGGGVELRGTCKQCSTEVEGKDKI